MFRTPRFLGDMVLNLWDCGGQDSFYETYFNYQQEFIFRSVEVRSVWRATHVHATVGNLSTCSYDLVLVGTYLVLSAHCCYVISPVNRSNCVQLAAGRYKVVAGYPSPLVLQVRSSWRVKQKSTLFFFADDDRKYSRRLVIHPENRREIGPTSYCFIKTRFLGARGQTPRAFLSPKALFSAPPAKPRIAFSHVFMFRRSLKPPLNY